MLRKAIKGLCWLGFMTSKEEGAYKGDGFERMKHHFPKTDFVRDDKAIQSVIDDLMQAWDHDTLDEINLDLYGSDFECDVWKALLAIP